MKKKILSLFLSACMVSTLFTAASFAESPTAQPLQHDMGPTFIATAGLGGVEYRRLKPEVAILNRYTGNSNKFYESLISDYSPYNAIRLFGLKSSTKTSNREVSYEGFYDSDLYQVALTFGEHNLKANASGTFHNNWHTHSWGFLGWYSQDVLAFSGMQLTIKGEPLRINGSQKSREVNARIGNDSFINIPYYGFDDFLPKEYPNLKEMKLKFTQSNVKYDGGNKTCSCDGHYVEKKVVSFLDDRSPKIKKIDGSIRTDGIFKEGEEITIVIEYDEPIRFADDTPNHGDLYVGLAISGRDQSSYPKAMLKKLDNKSLYFSYIVKPEDGLVTISGIDLSPLMGKDLPLKQVGPTVTAWPHGVDSSFSVHVPSDAGGNTTGFTTSTSYITDLAGNAATEAYMPMRAYIDTSDAFVTQIKTDVTANNQDVKDALGKTNPDNPEYADRSDNRLGQGDRIRLSIMFNKLFYFDYTGKFVIGGYDNLIATTNLKDKNGNPVTVDSYVETKAVSEDSQYGLGPSEGMISLIRFYNLGITSDMTCDDPDGIIRITGLSYKNPAKPLVDLAGKTFTNLNADFGDLMDKVLYLDTDLPEVTTEASTTIPGGDIYEVTPRPDLGNRVFRFPFTIKDGNEYADSGVNGLTGAFRWLMGKEALPFEYYISASDAAPAEEDWKVGYMGSRYNFNQVDRGQYIYIRPLQGQKYHVYDTEIEFYAKDYAGNSHSLPGMTPVKFKLDCFWDGMEPTAKVLASSRLLDETKETGTLKVDILLEDQSALDNKAYYLWNDGEEATENDDWKLTSIVLESDGKGTTSADARVGKGEVFKKHLWIKVSDTSENTLIAHMGEFQYNLGGIPYELTYSTGITSKASLKAVKIGDDGVDGILYYLVAAPGTIHGTDGEYFIRQGDIGDAFTSSTYLPWRRFDVREEGGEYTFIDMEEGNTSFIESITGTSSMNPTFSGSLPVTIISGLIEAFDEDSDESSSWTIAGTASHPVQAEKLVLRVSSNDNQAEDAFEGMTFRALQTINNQNPYDSYWDESDAVVLSTAEGVAFEVDLGRDVNGWNYEDIDFINSKIELSKYPYWDVKFPVPLSSSPIQTVVFPKDDYPSGRYTVRLYVNCKAGKNYYIDLSEPMYIDNQKESQDFGMSSLTYSPDPDSIDKKYCHGVDGSTNYFNVDGIYYMPVHKATAGGLPNILTVEVNDFLKDASYDSSYGVRAWNITAGALPEDAEFSSFRTGNDERSFWLTVWDRAEYAKAEKGLDLGADGKLRTKLGLIQNKANTIGIQVVNSNGKASEIQYYTIHPMDIEIKGTLTASRGTEGSNVVSEGNLTFTPDEGQLLEAVQVFATAWSDLEDKKIEGTQEMLRQLDDSYICPLIPGKHNYYVYSIDFYGNVSLIGSTEGEGQDYYNIVTDQQGPIITAISQETSNGLYEAKFRLEDDSLSAIKVDEDGRPEIFMPIQMILRFDEGHSQWLGIPENMTMEMTLNENGEKYGWKATGSSLTGIYEVIAERKWEYKMGYYTYYLEVTVKGVVGYKEDGGDSHDFTLFVDVLDVFGNSYIDETGISFTADNVKPLAYTSGTKAPAYKQIGFGFDKALTLQFNAPVLPEVSWICPQPELGTVQTDAFPITDDGAWEIIYYDILGRQYKQELLLDEVFKEYGLRLSLYPAVLTGDDVDFAVRTLEEDTEGALLLWKVVGDRIQIVHDEDWTHNTPMKEKKTTLSQNETLVVYRYDRVFTYEELFENGRYTQGDRLEIHVTHIGKAAPTAEPRFYFEESGSEYTMGNLPDSMETAGPVKVWYTTARHVLPTDHSGSEFIFKHDGVSSHIFTYVDDLGYEGSLTIDLGELGIRLMAPPEPPEPFKDETAPFVNVEVWKKISGNYQAAEAFKNMTAEAISESFDAAYYTQGYMIKVNASDESDYKIVLLKNEPVTPSYTGTVSDTIEGVSISGNFITITENLTRDFYVAIIDNASGQSAATADNFTFFMLKAGDMAKWFDTTAPVAETEYVSGSLYEKTAYIALKDYANNGLETATVILDSPKLEIESGGVYNGWYKRIFTENSLDQLIFYDLAGNQGRESISVDTIDTTPPELTTIWSPPLKLEDSEGNFLGIINELNPPLGPVNTHVTATTYSNKFIANVTAEYSTNNSDWDSMPCEGVSFTYSAESITARFEKGGVGIRLTVYAPNGRSKVETLFLAENVIDQKGPILTETVEYLKRSGYSKPYGVKITLEPDEPAYCLNVGKVGKLYNSGDPFELTLYEDQKINPIFVDKAGNRTIKSLTIVGVDSLAPVLKTEPEDSSSLEISGGSVPVEMTANENCKIVCDGKEYSLTKDIPKILIFDDNGVYLVTAWDEAGNTATATIMVGNIDKTAPLISFDKLTIGIRQKSEAAELGALLDLGVNVWDNLDTADKLRWNYDTGHVDLAIPGLYEVTYTVTDTAGNEGKAIRYIKVYDKNQPLIMVDNKITEPEASTVISIGEHQLQVSGLKEIAPGEMEPYGIKIRKGILTEGQMKYFLSTVPIDGNGKFTIHSEGFYTLYISTQSRQSYRTLLYVER